MLHAHPDDELLFAGALMMSMPDWHWTTVSLTGGARAHRYPGISLGFPDPWRILTRAEYLEWREAVRDLRLTPDIVLSHNRLGEYGHPHHMAVHAIAHELFRAVWDFYTDVPSSISPQHYQGQLRTVEVTGAKRKLLDATYPGVYDELRTNNPELIERLFEVEQFTY